jgi:hypothetical protein
MQGITGSLEETLDSSKTVTAPFTKLKEAVLRVLHLDSQTTPDPTTEEEVIPPTQPCPDLIESLPPTCDHLSPTPLLDTPSWFINGSFFKEPQPAAGYATVDPMLQKPLGAMALPPHSTSPWAELTPLSMGLILDKD